MIKPLLSLVIFAICTLACLGQYGNEWIDFTKTYYKFTLSEDGVYRISEKVLSEAGLEGVSGSQFRLFHNGMEVPIYTSTDGVYSATDFIEFYGLKNRGEMDRALYANPDAEQLNPRYSLFTDEAAYFLTWDDAGEGLRIQGIDNDLSNPPVAETYYMHADEWVYSDHVEDPRNQDDPVFISYSRYQEGEGFAQSGSSAFMLDIPASSVVVSGPDAHLSVRFASLSLTQHSINATFGGQPVLTDGNVPWVHLYQLDTDVPAAAVVSNQLLEVHDAAENGRFAVSCVQWTYPRQYDFTGRNTAKFDHTSAGAMQYFELQNFVHGGQDPVIYDMSAGVRLTGARDGNTIRFLLPAFTGNREIVVASQSDALHTVDALSERTFTNYTSDDTEYIIITHPNLRSGSDVVSTYAGYRRSTTGGNYDVKIYTIDDLTDQFGYGIKNHPQAIRNFSKLIRDNWPSAKMAFIIGKGITYVHSRDPQSPAHQSILVPTFGNPGADHLLFTENGESLPPFPVGRLPVSTPEQLQTYMAKIIEYDQVALLPQRLEQRGWTRHLLHLGGGSDASQQNLILSLMHQMAQNATTAEFGGYVTTYSKSSTNATGQSNSEKILEALRQGTGLVKFFGHSSASTLDFQINDPTDWQNKGKYPIFSAMGCKTGDIHQNFLSLSENFVFEPDAGVIAFIAGSGAQYLSALGGWGREWYDSFGHGVNSMTLGETVHESLAVMNQSSSLSSTLLVEQQTLNGDPAVRFHQTPGPDLLWDYRSVHHEPEIITVELDSFSMKADIVNIGTNIPGEVVVKVEQRFPDGSQKEVFTGTVPYSGFRTTLNFTLPVPKTSDGLNTLFLTLDVSNAVAELPAPEAEENNELVDAAGKRGYDIFILDDRAKVIRPLEFSIVTEELPEFIASSTRVFAKGENFVMELDTTPDFTDPLLREYFEGFGSLLRWYPVFDFVPGTVYYWRVSTNQGMERVWDSSSFLYNPGGQSGWNQSHYGQFQRDQLVNLDFDNNNRMFFDTIYRNFWFQNKVDFEPTLDDDPVVFVNNGLRRDFFTFWKDFDAHLFVVAIDSFRGGALGNPPGGLYGSVNTTQSILSTFPYNTRNPEDRKNLMFFLDSVITDGMYAIIYSYQRPQYMDYFPEEWAGDAQTYGKSIFDLVEASAPGSQIRSLEQTGSVPYLLFYRKNRELIFEGIANQLEETISFDYNFISHANNGSLTSTLIGPARKWHALQWLVDYSDPPANDQIQAQIVALSGSGQDSLVVDISTVQDTTLEFIDAAAYPYLYLKFTTRDAANLTAAVVDHWRVLYTGKPDLLINPARGFEFEADSLLVGQPMTLTTNVENLGEDMLNGTEVKFTVNINNNSFTQTAGIPALKSGESTLIHHTRDDLNVVGKGSLLVELNPDRSVEESNYLNNTGLLNFILLPDSRNPVLEVTFDGRHLVNGDIVSSRPVIVAQLEDDNPYLLLNNREDFEIHLRYPGAFDFTEIDIFSPEIGFEPATSSVTNIATITYRPTLTDGLYELLIQAKDRSNNKAGVLQYAVAFEVLGDPLVTHVEAHPSVFRDHTRFVFTLTGGETPADITLEISNVTGQIVRTIGKDEIGLFVGTTEYTWNGSTDAGEKLPGGVYIYRLIVKDQGGRTYTPAGGGFSTLRNLNSGKIMIVR